MPGGPINFPGWILIISNEIIIIDQYPEINSYCRFQHYNLLTVTNFGYRIIEISDNKYHLKINAEIDLAVFIDIYSSD
jgi:hypothetical protein